MIADHRLINASNPVSSFTYMKPRNEWPTATEARTIRANRGKRLVVAASGQIVCGDGSRAAGLSGHHEDEEKARRKMIGPGGKRSLLTALFGLLRTEKVGFLGLTGLVPGWARWYSENTYYREQTDALLKGSLAIEHTLTALQETIWPGTTLRVRLQRVWDWLFTGIWRLPFELLAKGLRAAGFFLTGWLLGAALMLVAFGAIRGAGFPPLALTHPLPRWGRGSRTGERGRKAVTIAAGGGAGAACFPAGGDDVPVSFRHL